MYDENGESLSYHLCCYKCGHDWWSNNAFPTVCPNCGKHPSYENAAKLILEAEEVIQAIKDSEIEGDYFEF